MPSVPCISPSLTKAAAAAIPSLDILQCTLGLTEEEVQALFKLLNVMDKIKPILPDEFESAYEKVLAAVYKQSAEKAEIQAGDREESTTGL